MSRLVVRTHHPLRVRLVTVLLLVVAVGSGWGLFEYGRFRGGFDAIAARQEQVRLAATAVEHETENRQLREQLAVARRANAIEREAYRELDGSVASLQDEILELKEELAFYRGIVSPSDGAEGLRLQRFELYPALLSGVWRYRLVLTQVLKNDTVASGTVDMVVEGTQDGAVRSLSIKELDAEGKGELPFKFKYFQDLEGELTLPEGFAPQKLTVTVDPQGKKRERLEKTFDWPPEES